MLSNCILSMSTTFLPLFLPSHSLPFFLFLPTLYPFLLSTAVLSYSWRLSFAVCVKVGGDSICHTRFTRQRILCPGVNASESRRTCLFAQGLCHVSAFLFVHIGPISVWLVSIAVSVRWGTASQRRPFHFHELIGLQWMNETRKGRGRGLWIMRHWMGEAHLKRLWSRRREGLERELKRGWMTFSALHTQISGKFLQFESCCWAGLQRRNSVEAAAFWKSRLDNLGMWDRRFWVEQENATTLWTLLEWRQKKSHTSWEYWPISCCGDFIT